MHEAIAAVEATVAADNAVLERRLAAGNDQLGAVARDRQLSRRLAKKERRRQTANEGDTGVEDSINKAGAGNKHERAASARGKAPDDQEAAEAVARGAAAARKTADKHASAAALKRKA